MNLSIFIVKSTSPPKCTSGDTCLKTFIIALPTVVLPQPDSPTIPNVSPRCKEKLTPSTAFTSAIFFVSLHHRLENILGDFLLLIIKNYS